MTPYKDTDFENFLNSNKIRMLDIQTSLSHLYYLLHSALFCCALGLCHHVTECTGVTFRKNKT